jgi:Domain of unknown function (DUF4157)
MSGSFVHNHRSMPRRDAAVSSLPRAPGYRGSVPRYIAELQGTIGNQAVAHLVAGTDPLSPGPRDASSGKPLEPAFRALMEGLLAHDFSGVRVHSDQAAAQSAHQVDARAFTVGGDIVLGAGAPSPGTRGGQRLLAHELAHVVQQHAGTNGTGRSEAGPDAEREADAAAAAVTRGHSYAVEGRTGVTIARQPARRPGAKTPDEELDEELQNFAASDHKSLDPKSPEYARTLQDYGFRLTHQSMTLRSEPKDPRAKAEWTKRFLKSELLASRILSQSGPQVEQKEERGGELASDLATAGFADSAMALARQIHDQGTRAYVYNSVLDRPEKVKPAQIAEITKFHISQQVAMTDNPVLKKLRANEGAYAKQLTPDKVNAGLAELVEGYEKNPDLPRELAEVLFFNPGSRAGFTKWMIGRKKGQLLRKVSEQPFFVEGAKIVTSKGEVNPSQGTLAWAIANKQKVAVEDILALASAAQSPIKPPTALDASSLKAWLDANTETIAQAIRKQHPGDPAAAEALLHQITDAFMYHVDPDGPDVKPDKSGKISHLEAGGPQRSQLKVDCDVLATYNVRFLVSSGFTPVGYMAIVPTDKSRAAHAMAILQYGQEWRAVSNMEARTFPATTTKDGALKMLRDFGIQEAYDASRPLTGFQVFYQDSDAKGTLPSGVSTNDASTLIPALGK